MFNLSFRIAVLTLLGAGGLTAAAVLLTAPAPQEAVHRRDRTTTPPPVAVSTPPASRPTRSPERPSGPPLSTAATPPASRGENEVQSTGQTGPPARQFAGHETDTLSGPAALVRSPHDEVAPDPFAQSPIRRAEGRSPNVDVETVRFEITPTPTSQLETRLASLQRQVERLAQAQQPETSDNQLQRALDTLQQLQERGQLQELQRQMLEQGTPPAPGSPLPSTPPAAPPVTIPPPGRTRTPIMKAAPSSRGGETFSLQIQDAEIGEVLEMLGGMAGRNILAGPGVTGTVSLNLTDVTLDEALEGLAKARGLVLDDDGTFMYVLLPTDAAARREAARQLITKVYRPHYITSADLLALITPLLTPQIGKAAVTQPAETGIPIDAEQAGGDRLAQRDALLVQDYPQVIQEVDRVLAEMDVPPLQVVIEAMILSVRLTDQMEFGVNFAFLNNQNDNLLVTGTGAVLNGATGFPGGGNESLLPAAGQFLANAAGLKYGFIAGDVAGFVEALETLTDTNLIASPTLRVMNKQRAQLIIGRRLSYVTRTFQNNQTIENVNFLDAGTKLIIRPFIAPDGLVRMEIHPERSSATINQQTNLPDLETTEVTSNVMVRDGTTVVIGGLIEEVVVQSQNRVPLLGSIPLLGYAFRDQQDRIERQELIVLITPRIVREPLAAAEGAQAVIENEFRRDHFKEELVPINRYNLARHHYELAERYFRQDKLQRAVVHIEMSLEHSKNSLEALRLRNAIREALKARAGKFLPIFPDREPPTQPFIHPTLPAPACPDPGPEPGPIPGDVPLELPMPAGERAAFGPRQNWIVPIANRPEADTRGR